MRVLEEQGEARPSLLGRDHGTVWRVGCACSLEVLDQRPAQRPPNLKAFGGTPAIHGALDLEQCMDPAHDLDRNGREWDLLFARGLTTAFSSMSAMTKNGRRAWTQHAASRIGPGWRPGR
jgi:hypothetical protein